MRLEEHFKMDLSICQSFKTAPLGLFQFKCIDAEIEGQLQKQTRLLVSSLRRSLNAPTAP